MVRIQNKGRQKRKKDTQNKLSLKLAIVTIRLTPNPRWSISKWLINKKKGHARQTVPQTCLLNHHCFDHNPLLILFKLGIRGTTCPQTFPKKKFTYFHDGPQLRGHPYPYQSFEVSLGYSWGGSGDTGSASNGFRRNFFFGDASKIRQKMHLWVAPAHQAGTRQGT